MTGFFVAVIVFILFFVIFYGATKLLGYASRNRKGQDPDPSDPEGDH